MPIKIEFINIRPSVQIKFYKDIDTVNYVLNKYVYPEKLKAITTLSDDELIQTTVLIFTNQENFIEVTKDPIIIKHNENRNTYNSINNITSFSKEIL